MKQDQNESKDPTCESSFTWRLIMVSLTSSLSAMTILIHRSPQPHETGTSCLVPSVLRAGTRRQDELPNEVHSHRCQAAMAKIRNITAVMRALQHLKVRRSTGPTCEEVEGITVVLMRTDRFCGSSRCGYTGCRCLEVRTDIARWTGRMASP